MKKAKKRELKTPIYRRRRRADEHAMLSQKKTKTIMENLKVLRSSSLGNVTYFIQHTQLNTQAHLYMPVLGLKKHCTENILFLRIWDQKFETYAWSTRCDFCRTRLNCFDIVLFFIARFVPCAGVFRFVLVIYNQWEFMLWSLVLIILRVIFKLSYSIIGSLQSRCFYSSYFAG